MGQRRIASTFRRATAAPLSATATSEARQHLLRSPLAHLLGVVFSIDAMTALVVIAFGQSYLISTRHAPPEYPAYSLAIYGFVKLVSAPIGGWAIDRVRAGVALLFVVAVELAGFATIFVTASADGYLGAVALLSTGIALAWLIVFHALGDAIAAEMRASATAYVGLTSAAAMGFGFGVAAVIGQTRYWEVAFGIGTAFAVVSGLLLAGLYPFGSTIGRTVADDPLAADSAFADGRPAGERTRQLVAGAVVFAHFVAITATIAVFGPYALRLMKLSLLGAGVALIPAGAIGAVAMIAAGRRSRPGNRLHEVAVLYAFGAAALFGLAPSNHVWLLVVLAIPLAISIGGAQPLLNASVLDISQASHRTGRALGWLFFAEGLGSVAGPLLVGVVIAATDVRSGMVALGALDALIVVLAALGSRAIRL